MKRFYYAFLLAVCLTPSFTVPQAVAAQAPAEPEDFKVATERSHTFLLQGGYFYGPGPIEPDTQLPDGRLVNIRFDRRAFEGLCPFANDGSEEAVLSDGRTRINQNIEAGELKIGDGERAFLLAAVDGGPNHGRERYYLDEHYTFNWKVDLALDPGFEDAIIRVDDFVLTTGLVRMPLSVQSQKGLPGGHDQAGSQPSGSYLIGRVGDFDQDGYLDGVLVAAPNVPMESAMLPGAPVGNVRGFTSDIEIPPHLACELTLRAVLNFRRPLQESIDADNNQEAVRLLGEARQQLQVARTNLERALLVGAWKEFKQEGFDLTWRLDAVQMLGFIAWGILDGYEYPAGKVPSSVRDASQRMFDQLEKVIEQTQALNKRTGDALPVKEGE